MPYHSKRVPELVRYLHFIEMVLFAGLFLIGSLHSVRLQTLKVHIAQFGNLTTKKSGYAKFRTVVTESLLPCVFRIPGELNYGDTSSKRASRFR